MHNLEWAGQWLLLRLRSELARAASPRAPARGLQGMWVLNLESFLIGSASCSGITPYWLVPFSSVLCLYKVGCSVFCLFFLFSFWKTSHPLPSSSSPSLMKGPIRWGLSHRNIPSQISRLGFAPGDGDRSWPRCPSTKEYVSGAFPHRRVRNRGNLLGYRTRPDRNSGISISEISRCWLHLQRSLLFPFFIFHSLVIRTPPHTLFLFPYTHEVILFFVHTFFFPRGRAAFILYTKEKTFY